MERYCAVFRIAPGSAEEFRPRHVEIWPEMLDGMRRSGFANYSLFRRGEHVIAYAECQPDVESCFSSFMSLPVAARWNDYMADQVLQIVDDDGNPYRYDEVWHLE